MRFSDITRCVDRILEQIEERADQVNQADDKVMAELIEDTIP